MGNRKECNALKPIEDFAVLDFSGFLSLIMPMQNGKHGPVFMNMNGFLESLMY